MNLAGAPLAAVSLAGSVSVSASASAASESPLPGTPSVASARRALARARRGQSVNREEIASLLSAAGHERDQLLELASGLRDQGLRAAGRPGVVTFSPKVFIPLTRLCRDSCRYCVFVSTPAQLRAAGQSPYLEPDQVLNIARAGAKAGCAEALFTLGDRPEARWEVARNWLDERGYDSTLGYLRAMSLLVLEETGLLPHLNPGVMSWEELARLRPVSASMGLMLESSSTRLFTDPAGPHYGSPDKDPAVRLRTIQDAGRLSIPFTTGLLVGIGETVLELADSLLEIRRVSREFGHIQEVIIQNFRAKPTTAMAAASDLRRDAYVNAVAVARIVLGPGARIQAPPNLSALEDLPLLISAGVDDWGGVSPVTADHVNPERVWPVLDSLRERTQAAGMELRARLATHPEYVTAPARWIAAPMLPFVSELAAPDGLLTQPANPVGKVWREAGSYAEFSGSGAGRTDLNTDIDSQGRHGEFRGDFGEVYGDWELVGEQANAIPRFPAGGSARRHGTAFTSNPITGDLRRGLDLAADNPAALADPANEAAAVALMSSTGSALAELARIADAVRADRVGDDVTYVVNRNINFTNVCYTGCRFCAFAQRETDPDAFTLSLAEVGERVVAAARAGATEICMQGGIHPRLPGTAYFDLVAEVKRRVPRIHLHAFSPMEVHNGSNRSGMSVADWLTQAKAAGLDSIPGTAAEILDDDVRWILTKGKLPTRTWIEVVSTAHRLGIPSSSTMMYGHVDAPIHWVRHLRLLREIQERTGGFTEFVGLPYVHRNAPLHLAGISRPGPTARDDVAVTAMARIMLYGSIDNIQVSWVKLGRSRCADLLRAGANDVGGTLMEETISRMAGSEHGSALTVAELREIAELCGRPARQRTTLYGPAPSAPSDAVPGPTGPEPGPG